jgi:hypothetical protein
MVVKTHSSSAEEFFSQNLSLAGFCDSSSDEEECSNTGCAVDDSSTMANGVTDDDHVPKLVSSSSFRKSSSFMTCKELIDNAVDACKPLRFF